jgi:hypothetical protein
MATCAYCNTTIFLGGKRQGDLRFCNATCLQRGALASVARALPQPEVDQYVARVHRGQCPACQGVGPVDVHTSYRVWSLLFMTSWSSRPKVCCQGCGTKRKVGDTVFSVVLGWWGFPWGFLVTPMQVIRNVWGVVNQPDPSTPSPALEQMLRLEMAARAASVQGKRLD